MPPTASPPTADTVVAALLAGGASRRMGRGKAALEIGGRPLASYPARALEAVAAIRVQVGGEPLQPPGWPVLQDAWTGAGPAAGIATALLHFPGAAVVVCGVDLPFVTAALLGALLAKLPDRDAAVPRHGGRWHPLAAAYSPRILPRLRARLDAGEGSLQALLDAAVVAPLQGDELARLGDPERLLLNVNTPADLERARQLL